MKKHNFSSGPSILPASVMEEAAQGVIDFNGSGLSILEMSHRSKGFMEVMEETEALLRELLGLTTDYHVLFLSGGASSQFFMVPMNLLGAGEKAAYLDTGTWSSKAIKEARRFGKLEVVASSKEANFTYIPKNYELPENAKYFHLTTNNTIYGTQLHHLPTSPIPLVADMSSDFLSKPIPLAPFGLIYAGAQKNVGPAGVTIVIIRKDFLANTPSNLPTMLDYRTHVEHRSMFNTPPVFPIYVSMLTLRWLKAQGGTAAIALKNEAKAQLLYQEIDRNPLFRGVVAKEDRSLMNVTFTLQQPALESSFLEMCKAAAIDGIKGHRSVGGFRASLYNALPIDSVQVLVEVMQTFAAKHGE